MADQDIRIPSAAGDVAGVARTTTRPQARTGFWQGIRGRIPGLGQRNQPSLNLMDLAGAQDAALAAAQPTAPVAEIAAEAAAKPPVPREIHMFRIEKKALEASNARRRAQGLPESAAYYMDTPLIQQERAKLLESLERATTLDARIAHMKDVGEPAFDFMRQEAAVAQPQGIAGKLGGWMNSAADYFKPQPRVTPINAAALGTKWADMPPPNLKLPMDAPHVNAPTDPFEVTERLKNPQWQTPVEWPTRDRLYEAGEARLASQPAPDMPAFLDKPLGSQPLETVQFSAATRRPGGALRISASLATAEPAMRPVDTFGSPSWRGASLEPAAHRLPLSEAGMAGVKPPIDMTQPITVQRARPSTLSGSGSGHFMKRPPAAAPNFVPLENYRAAIMPEGHLAAAAEAVEAVETAAKPGILQRARVWFAQLTTPKTLAQRYPKMTALSENLRARRFMLREVAEGRLAEEPHLPFPEKAPGADYLPYESSFADETRRGLSDINHPLLTGDTRLADVEKILAQPGPAVAPIAAAAPTAPTVAELEALGQERLRMPPQSRILSDVPFGPEKPPTRALTVVPEPILGEEIAEAAAAQPGWFARWMDRFKNLFRRKESAVGAEEVPLEGTTAPKAAPAAGPALQPPGQAQSAGPGTQGLAQGAPGASTSGTSAGRGRGAGGGGGAGSGAGAASHGGMGHTPRASVMAQEASKGGRAGLIVGAALAAVGGAAYLLSRSEGHEQREFRRRIEPANGLDTGRF